MVCIYSEGCIVKEYWNESGDDQYRALEYHQTDSRQELSQNSEQEAECDEHFPVRIRKFAAQSIAGMEPGNSLFGDPLEGFRQFRYEHADTKLQNLQIDCEVQ